MSASRTLRVGAEQWQRLQRDARAGAADGVAGVLAGHLAAPVTALLVTTAGGRGVRTRLTMTGGRAVLVAQRLAELDGEARVEPGAQLTFTGADGLWEAVARTLPDREQLRAPARAVVGGTRRLGLPPANAARLLEREDCAVHVRVEARPRGERPAVAWGRWWSVVDGRLLDVRADDGELDLVERPAGSVAQELRWALAGALDATSGGHTPPSSDNDAPTGDDPTGDDPTGGDPTGDDPTGDDPTGGDPTGSDPTGDVPTGDVPTGDVPTGDGPAGDGPAGGTRSGGVVVPGVEPAP